METEGSDWSRLVWACIAAAQGMVLSLALNVSSVEGQMRWVLHGVLATVAVAVALLAGGPLWEAAVRGLRERRVVAEHFFALGMAAAFAVSIQSTVRGSGPLYYEVVAVLVAVHALGHLLGGRRRREFASLQEVFLQRYSRCFVRGLDGKFEERDARDVEVGDVVLVPAGQACCVDGVVTEGSALVDESTLTGEPFPVVKRKGDVVFAGCVVCDVDLLVAVKSKGGNRAIDKISASVECAMRERSGLTAVADRLSALLMPVVLSVAGLSFAVWLWLADFDTALMRALAVIVVACPCAMGLATPIGIWSALAAFARRGLVAFHGDFVERLSQVRTVMFDKTGTLSEPGMVLADWVVAEGEDGDTLRRVVEILENQHHHPVAEAFRRSAGTDRLSGLRLVSSRVIPGCGIEGTLELADGSVMRIAVGNEGLLSGDELKNEARILRKKADDRHAPRYSHEVFVLKNGRAAGLARLREIPREDAALALEALSHLGLQVSVLTGDREEALRNLGLGVSGVTKLSPQEKGEWVGKSERKGNRVLYVGDGINDVTAMGRAFVSIAMGSGVPDVKGQASAVLLGRQLVAVAECVGIARRVVREIEANMFIAIAYNSIGILLAAFGLISPVFAAVLMLISSATVSYRAFRSARSLQGDSTLGGGGDVTSSPGRSGGWPNESRPVEPDAVVVPRGVAALICLSVWAQVPFAVWMAGLGPFVVTGGLALGALLSLALWHVLVRHPLKRLSAWLAVMLGSGNLGMLIGWVATWGFAPIIREGICLCGCPKSPFGQGVALNFGLMHVGMLLGCVPLFFLRRADGSNLWDGIQFGRCGLCFLGMIIGMNLGALVVGGLSFTNGQVQFMVNFGAMTFGMLLGMGILDNAGGLVLRKVLPNRA